MSNIYNLKGDGFALAQVLSIQFKGSWIPGREPGRKVYSCLALVSGQQSRHTVPESEGPGTKQRP